MWLKVVIVLLFLAVVASLGRGLYFLLTDQSGSAKLISSLTARISLTALIMLVIVIAWLHGDINSQAPWLYR
ncbi:MAG: DUF2909 domain-containing protein [Endozoicomonas sp.]